MPRVKELAEVYPSSKEEPRDAVEQALSSKLSWEAWAYPWRPRRLSEAMSEDVDADAGSGLDRGDADWKKQ